MKNTDIRRKRVLINCDDMGYHIDINDAIIEIINAGFVKSLSLMATGPSFDDAVEKLHNAGIKQLGAHLVLAAEYPNLPMAPVSSCLNVPSLITDAGLFYQDISEVREMAKPEEIKLEMEQQLKRIILAGFKISHVDGHMFWYEKGQGGTAMHDIVAGICRQYKVPLRSSTLHSSRVIEQVDMLWDGFESSRQRFDQYRELFKRKEARLSELIIHPAKNPVALAKFTATGNRRIADYEFFSSAQLGPWLKRAGIEIVGWQDLHV